MAIASIQKLLRELHASSILRIHAFSRRRPESWKPSTLAPSVATLRAVESMQRRAAYSVVLMGGE